MDNMTITSAQYTLDMDGVTNTGIQATIDGQEMSVPLDLANRHFSAIMKAVEEGTLTIEDAD